MQTQTKRYKQYCFLHVGKTAGTALRAVIEQHNEARPGERVDVFTHETTLPNLCDIHPECSVIFFVRDPIERFVSGFNSRLRCGRPRYDVPWTEDETATFERFPTANSLGEALSPHHTDWPAAKTAMNSIYHARLDLVHYLRSPAFLEEAKERIAFIGETRSFDSDVELLKQCLGIDRAIRAPIDAVGAHRNPAEFDDSLSTLASTNLRCWYEGDYCIYDWCTERRRFLLAKMLSG